MKKEKRSLFVRVLLLATITGTLSCAAQRVPAKKEVLQAMELTNGYFMQKWPDVGKPIVTNATRPSNIWTRAVYYEGLMALYAVKGKKEYYNYANDWGVFHKWGLRGGIPTRNADNQACGQTYIDLYLLDKKAEQIHDIKASVDSMMRTAKIDDWNWIDAIQMAMPVFARLGKIYDDTTYYHRMMEMYNYSKYKHGGNGLFNAADGLWWRDKDFVPPYKAPNGEDCYWSRGNGWVLASYVRTLEWLPKSNPYYQVLLNDFLAMSKALVPIQRADGFWNVSLHDSTHFGGKELTGTALFVYGMSWGMNHGYLDKKIYRPIVVKAWNAMVKECVHENGFLGYVQGTGKEPKDGQPVSYTSVPDFEDYGLGCFLLAGSEMYRLK
jgi:rhamnogalacturonyl hydrolase YesR